MRDRSSGSGDSGSRSSVRGIDIDRKELRYPVPVSDCRRMEHEYDRSTDTAAGKLVM